MPALQAALDAEVSARIAADNAEETTRSSADDALQAGLDAEVTARTSADTALQTALNIEVSERLAGDANLQNALDSEVSTRLAGDNNLQAQIDSLDATALESRLADIEDNTVLALDGLLTYNDTAMTAIFSGVNVQVVNGAGSTNSINGLGNLIVGYDAARSIGSDKTGSHNLVIGDQHNYNRFGGLVAGRNNAITGDWASVSGGKFNTASGDWASVSGGFANTASGTHRVA